MEKKMGYRDLWSEKNYIKSFIANMINRFGDSIDALAFAWMVYEITGDRSWSAIIFGLNSLPTILLMPFAGVFVEKFDKRRIMIIADIGRALLVTLIAVLYMTGRIVPVMLAISTFLMSTFEAFRIPAGLGIYPKIVPREKYTVATSFSQACASVATIIGSASFGVIVYTMGLQDAMLINAATFVISAVFISLINLPKETVQDIQMNIKHFFIQLKEGVGYFYTKKIIFLICAVSSLLGVLFIPFNSMLTPYIKESLGMNEGALSVISISMLLGNVVGTIFFPMINNRVSKSRLFIAGGLTVSVGYLIFAMISFLPNAIMIYSALITFSFILGFGSSFTGIVVNIAFMENIDTAYLGRVGAIFNSMASALTPVASFIIAGIVVYFTVNQVFVVSGILSIVLFVVFSFNKLFKTIDAPKVAEEKKEAEIQ